MKTLITTLIVALLLFNCTPEDINRPILDPTADLVAKGNLDGAGAEGIPAGNNIITNLADWEALKSQMNLSSDLTDTYTEMDIDFSEFTVVAVFDDIKLGNGDSIELDVEFNDETTLISITYLSGLGDLVARYGQPFHIIKITKTDAAILFQ